MPISPFTPQERRAVEAAMVFRYGQPVALEDAEVELKLNPASETLTLCPGVFWQERGVQFVVCKTGEGRFRSYFYYVEEEQFRIGERDYDAIEDCLRELLRLQADHQAMRRATVQGSGLSDDEYTGPIVI